MDTVAAAWATCTRQLRASSFELRANKSPALASGAFLCVPSMLDSLGVIVSRRRVIVMLYER